MTTTVSYFDVVAWKKLLNSISLIMERMNNLNETYKPKETQKLIQLIPHSVNFPLH